MSEWRLIEIAPKDGTDVLLYVPEVRRIMAASYKASITTGYFDNGSWHLCETGGYAEDDEIYPTPTHWMPLPEPPK